MSTVHKENATVKPDRKGKLSDCLTSEITRALRQSGISDDEATAEAAYSRFFSNRENVHIELSGFEASNAEMAEEVADKQERTQSPRFEATEVLSLQRLTLGFKDTCAACGFKGGMSWQATRHDNSWILLCGSCGDKLDSAARGELI